MFPALIDLSIQINYMQPLSNHSILVAADSFESGCHQVEEFFANTLLVRYDRISIVKERCYSSADNNFRGLIEKNVEENRKTLQRFIQEFEKTGYKTIADMSRVKCGYPSKLLHIITHFLDGFIGIDSTFYNLHEDSHWVSDTTFKEMEDNSVPYWLIYLDCFAETPEQVSLVQA